MDQNNYNRRRAPGKNRRRGRNRGQNAVAQGDGNQQEAWDPVANTQQREWQRRGPGGNVAQEDRNQQGARNPVANTQQQEWHRRGPGGNDNNQTRRNQHRDGEGDNRRDRPNRPMGFRTLEEILNSEEATILMKVSDKSNSFQLLLDSDVEKPDMYALIIRVIAKVTLSAFEDLTLKFVLNVCHSKLIPNLQIYLMGLPYTSASAKRNNNMYWKNPTEFWENFICFCEFVLLRSPSTALQKLRALAEGIVKVCLDGLKERHGYKLPMQLNGKLNELLFNLDNFEKKEEEVKEKYQKSSYTVEEFGQPPEDFRLINILPGREDLLNDRPFLRPNIVQGSYQNMEHYLDVQFRLLREDCFGPLREGILQFIKDPSRKRFDNIRVYTGVQFVEPYVSKHKIGEIIQFNNKSLKKINWAHSKRLIFGSLLLITKNDFQDVIIATVLDRDEKLLLEGKIPVNPVNIRQERIRGLENDSFIMIESEVYFEPYYHVLKALQDPSITRNIAMSKYIIEVDTVPRIPAYMTQETTYTMKLKEGYPKAEMRPLDATTWPDKEELGLNDTQYEAYKLALTHEFAVIQGPPGTGKTFLGVKVAETLLDNVKGVHVLLICYTNHALDQFLEAILPITKSIVRIGGQSRSETLKDYNLVRIRRDRRGGGYSTHMQQKIMLEKSVSKMNMFRRTIDRANNGVLKYDVILNIVSGCFVIVSEVQKLAEFYKPETFTDILMEWLFENLDLNERIDVEIDNYMQDVNTDVNIDDDDPHRLEIELDDFDINEIVFNDAENLTTFELNKAIKEIRMIAQTIRTSEDIRLTEKLQYDSAFITALVKRYKDMSPLKEAVSNIKFTDKPNPRDFTIPERWILYFKWTKILVDKVKNDMQLEKIVYETAETEYEESRMMMDLNVLRTAKVVGITTSGAARLRKLIKSWAPNVVIVEEAAEVLESHIITSLTRHCQHLILIGDHQQLRPSASHYKLARYYNMEISLFERMINNGIHCRRLSVQHRMRPEIASLITPAIYPDLLNHQSVHTFPQVRGVTHNLFFLTHNFKENVVSDSASRCNTEEADLTLALANYLMQQGYEPEHVTILAAYSGQVFYMKKQKSQYAFLSKIKMTVVDNYQGEESKIILLSLVRNNDENRVGFLSTVNRVCVALSRAREGFYMIGNIDILKRNADIWIKVATTLENIGSLGTYINLRCETHREEITSIRSAEDFQKVPEGGCMLKCPTNLSCGHPCHLICHGYDRGHTEIQCTRPCERILCELGHVCPQNCKDTCGPCRVLKKKTLPCKHDMLIFCSQNPEDPGIKCKTSVMAILPVCGHEVKKPCYLDVKKATCYIPCEYRVDPCGHQCRLSCHVGEDPYHKNYLCEKPCARAKKGCKAELVGDRGDHQCPKRCQENCDDCKVEVNKKRSSCKHSERVACCDDVDAKPCRKNCARSMICGHFCKKKCFEPCGDCTEMVTKVIADCGHQAKLQCGKEPTRRDCKKKCERYLPCGHVCADRCDELCNPQNCTVVIEEKFLAKCGHSVQLPCNVFNSIKKEREVSEAEAEAVLLAHCAAPCGLELACGHACGGSCARCLQGRLHEPCAQPCHKPNICGHQCKEPCNQLCPPCNEKCVVKCVHTKCNKTCGMPCVPCPEKCSRRCKHSACIRRCGEPCSREPCTEACDRTQKCGHRCRGLCGEPCPDICNICHPEDFPTDFLGDNFEDHDKFVKLQDCSHVMEVENMDNLMLADQETVGVKTCPYCRTPIINTYRYKDLINKKLESEINPIKERVYGTKQKIADLQKILMSRVLNFRQKYDQVLKVNKPFILTYERIKSKVQVKSTNASLLQLEMWSVALDILDMIGECYNKFHQPINSTILLDKFNKQIKMLCTVVVKNMNKISPQQQKDIGLEIKRMQSIVQLSKIIGNTAYNKDNPKVVTASELAKKAVFSWNIFQVDTTLTALKALQEAVNLSGIITEKERALVVKAINLKQGHWFKCPNGHFYCIGECGGAMEVGRCYECGANIGGQRHRLLGDNQHAPEMDNSRHPAWSDIANNMANFQI